MAWSLRGESEFGHSASASLGGVHVALGTRNLELARQWLKAAESESAKHPCRNCDRLVAEAEIECLLFSGADYERVRSAYRRYLDQLSRINGIHDLDETIVRVELLNGDRGDPGESSHPARRQMLLKRPGPHCLPQMYWRSLISTDYHLACLRYCVGIDAVDDGYYTIPQSVPIQCVPMDGEGFDDRVRRARLAVERTMKHAKTLDGWLECDWRQKSVESRRKRLEEIATAVR